VTFQFPDNSKRGAGSRLNDSKFHAADVPMPLKRDDDPQGCNGIDVTALFPVSKAFLLRTSAYVAVFVGIDRMDRSLYLNPLDSYRNAGLSGQRQTLLQINRGVAPCFRDDTFWQPRLLARQ
jgi:hypothetical protein